MGHASGAKHKRRVRAAARSAPAAAERLAGVGAPGLWLALAWACAGTLPCVQLRLWQRLWRYQCPSF